MPTCFFYIQWKGFIFILNNIIYKGFIQIIQICHFAAHQHGWHRLPHVLIHSSLTGISCGIHIYLQAPLKTNKPKHRFFCLFKEIVEGTILQKTCCLAFPRLLYKVEGNASTAQNFSPKEGLWDLTWSSYLFLHGHPWLPEDLGK